MVTLTATERAILDTTSHESTNLEQIYEHLHKPPAPVPLAEAAAAVQNLVSKGLLATEIDKEDQTSSVSVNDDLRLLLKARFAMTQTGREAWTSTLVEPPRHSLFGVWKDRGIHLKPEDIQNVRQEMWENFPRNEPK